MRKKLVTTSDSVVVNVNAKMSLVLKPSVFLSERVVFIAEYTPCTSIILVETGFNIEAQ